jgi:hypothetical protein
MGSDDGEIQTAPPEITYSDGEVGDIMVSLQNIYALDDAIYNQTQLNRPETFIKPLKDMRKRIGDYLTQLTSKTTPVQQEQK